MSMSKKPELIDPVGTTENMFYVGTVYAILARGPVLLQVDPCTVWWSMMKGKESLFWPFDFCHQSRVPAVEYGV
jgi:hypothetical protein